MNKYPIYVLNSSGDVIMLSDSDCIPSYPKNLIFIFNLGSLSPQIIYKQNGDLQMAEGYVNPWTYWDNTTKLSSIRLQRDYLLGKSDWIVSKYAETLTEVPQNWRDYRQQLRDFPNTVNVNLPIEQIVWPVSP